MTVDEETPLLADQTNRISSRPKARFPWGQFSILLVLQLAEPMTYQVIAPFAPQLIRDVGVTHGDERKVGYYVGLMHSLFFVTQAITVLHWSTLSDHVGRKPIILTGLFGIALSMFALGLSKSFAQAVIARCLSGALNGNVGVLKSHFASLFDPSNIADAYAYLPIAWSTGGTIGPLIGGLLVHPAERYSSIFGSTTFLKAYPYFLPCAVSGTFALFAWALAFSCLKETVASPVSVAHLCKRFLANYVPRSKTIEPAPEATAADDASVTTAVPTDDESEQEPAKHNRPLPISRLFTREVIIAGGNYAMLSILDIMFRAILPLFLSTPRQLGGLELTPSKIGTILSAYGVGSGLFEILFFARIVKFMGVKYAYMLGVGASILVFGLFPLVSLLATRREGLDHIVWMVVAAQLALSTLSNIAYGAVFIFITAASPNRASLGSTNGLCQLVVAWFRAVGPLLANSLYSASLHERSWTVYWALEALSILGILVACLLPERPWKD